MDGLMTDTIGVYYFSTIPMDFLRQRPQQLFDAWPQRDGGCFTFYYVEPPCLHLKVRYGDSRFYTVLPWETPQAQKTIGALIEAACERHARRVAICAEVWEPMIARCDFALICYDYCDVPEVMDRHQKLLAKSDLVIAATERLRQDVLARSPDKEVLLVSNGVDPAFFQTHRSRIAGDYVKNRPTAGFVGAVWHWIDVELIAATAVLLPDVDFLMIGPVAKYITLPTAGTGPPNLLWLGEKPYGQIPSYIDLFDVALIPFKPGTIAETADPIKLYEYFVLGKPVVSTSVRQAARYGDGRLLKIAGTAEDFAEAIRFFLRHDQPDWRDERRSIAGENSWSRKADLICDHLGTWLGRAGSGV